MTASARLDQDRRYQLRRSVNLLAADYRTGGDLPEVAAVARRGSPFQRAQAQEFDRTTRVLNPTGAEMETAIFSAILGMWQDLTSGEVGQLVITFSGHGGGGDISGVDWVDVTGQRLEDLAEFAADHDVHVIYVLDTCRSGALVDRSQGASIQDISRRLGDVPADRRRPLVLRYRYVRRLLRAAFEIGDAAHVLGDRADDERRRGTDENRLAYTQSVLELVRKSTAMGQLLDGTPVPEGMPSMQALRALQQRLGWSALAGAAGRASDEESILRDVAAVLDAVNDVANVVLPAIDADIRAIVDARRGTEGAGRAR